MYTFQPEDLFVQTIDNQDISAPPSEKKYKKSQCTPLFMNAYTLRSKLPLFMNAYTLRSKFMFLVSIMYNSFHQDDCKTL